MKREWQSGRFEKSRVNSAIHPFVPVQATDALENVDLMALWDSGKRLILIDVDNTIVRWKAEDFEESTLAWLQQAKDVGFSLCILSNTSRPERLDRICARLGIPTVRGRRKPSRNMYELALQKFDRKPNEAVMIGDQLMTDILGANRSGIDAIWVQRIHHHEFKGTAVNRFIERLLTGPIYRALVVPESEAAVVVTPQQTLIKQLFRFLVVGGTSFLIDYAVKLILLRGTGFGNTVGQWLIDSLPNLFSFAKEPQGAAAPVVAVLAWVVASINSFLFNRAWTFNAKGSEVGAGQAKRFWLVALVAVTLNAGLYTLVVNALPGHPILPSSIIASGVVAIWNFWAMRKFAFRADKS